VVHCKPTIQCHIFVHIGQVCNPNPLQRATRNVKSSWRKTRTFFCRPVCDFSPPLPPTPGNGASSACCGAGPGGPGGRGDGRGKEATGGGGATGGLGGGDKGGGGGILDLAWLLKPLITPPSVQVYTLVLIVLRILIVCAFSFFLSPNQSNRWRRGAV